MLFLPHHVQALGGQLDKVHLLLLLIKTPIIDLSVCVLILGVGFGRPFTHYMKNFEEQMKCWTYQYNLS